jgi:hypothetical protein
VLFDVTIILTMDFNPAYFLDLFPHVISLLFDIHAASNIIADAKIADDVKSE